MREGDWKLYAKARESVRRKGIPEMDNADKKQFLVNLAKDRARSSWAEDHPASSSVGTRQALSGRLGEEGQINLLSFLIP